MSLEWLLRGTGVSLLMLAASHGLFWRLLKWRQQTSLLTPLNARVFLIHLLFIVLILTAQGVLLVARAELLVARSELATWLLAGLIAFFGVRLVVQWLVFDPVLALDSPWRTPLRIAASSGWLGYVLIFSFALARQLEA